MRVYKETFSIQIALFYLLDKLITTTGNYLNDISIVFLFLTQSNR